MNNFKEKGVQEIDFINAIYIQERINIAGKNEGINYESLHKWRSKRGLVTDKNFDQMLLHTDTSVEEFSNAITDIQKDDYEKYSTFIKNSQFYKCIESSFEYIKNEKLNYDEMAGPIYIFRPFLTKAKLELMQKKSKLRIKLNDDVINSIISQLADNLYKIAIKSIILELHEYKVNNMIEGESPQDRFNSFCKTYVNQEKLYDFYSKYSVLARMIAESTIYFINNVDELLSRLDKDIKDIHTKFNIPSDSSIVCIQLGKGDTHEKGKTVGEINFSTSQKIIYKPKDLRIIESYNKFINWINSKNMTLSINEHNVITFDNYAYEIFITNDSCKNESEVREYFTRFGQILSIMYVLNGTDFHMENLIANGAHPTIVDYETIIQNRMDFNLDMCNLRVGLEKIHNFVSTTALLPTKDFMMNLNSSGVDLSGLNGKKQTIQHQIETIVNQNSDEMEVKSVTGITIAGADNIPRLNGEPVSYENYIQEILDGFATMCNVFIQNKEELLSKNSVLCEFKDMIVRIILRSTMVYANVLETVNHPDYTKNALMKEKVLENLWIHPFENKGPIHTEYNDILNGDVPVFYTNTSSNDLIDVEGTMYKSIFPKSGYELMIDKIKQLDDKVVREQCSVISFYTNEVKPKKINIY